MRNDTVFEIGCARAIGTRGEARYALTMTRRGEANQFFEQALYMLLFASTSGGL